MERVASLWDRPPIRRTFAALSALVLLLGVAAYLGRNLTPGQDHFSNAGAVSQARAQFGREIPLPKQAVATEKTFIRAAVLRRDMGLAWRTTVPRLHAAVTRAQWNAGTLPIEPFPSHQYRGSSYHVVRSRERDVLLKVTMAATAPKWNGRQYYLEMVPSKGHWLVKAWVTSQVFPVPAAGGF